MTITGGVAAACGAVGLFLGWLQASAVGAGVGTLLLGCGLWMGTRWPKQADPPVAQPLFTPQAVAALDDALQALASELPPTLAPALGDLKSCIARIARHPAAATIDEYFSLDDRMYVIECVRRYIPDSILAYLGVPAAQRALPVADGPSAEAMLVAQLAQLRQELDKREAKLARSAGEALLRQERFLRSKASD